MARCSPLLPLLSLAALFAPIPARRTPLCNFTTLAGTLNYAGRANGPALSSTFNGAAGLALSPTGAVLIADTRNNQVRAFDPAANQVSAFIGSGAALPFREGPAASATLRGVASLCAAPSGVLYMADTMNRRVRALVDGVVSTLSGNGSIGAGPNTWRAPTACAWDARNAQLLVTDNLACTVRSVDAGSGVALTLAGLPCLRGSTAQCRYPQSAIFAPGSRTPLLECDYANGLGTSARFSVPVGIAVEPGLGRTAYIVDQFNHGVRTLALVASPGVQLYAVGTLAGCRVMPVLSGNNILDGVGSAAGFWSPSFAAFDGFGGLVITDTFNNALRYIDTETMAVSTLAGFTGREGVVDGGWEGAEFNGTTGIALWLSAAGDPIEPNKSTLVFMDTDSNVLRSATCVLPLGSPTSQGSGGQDAGLVIELSIAGAVLLGAAAWWWGWEGRCARWVRHCGGGRAAAAEVELPQRRPAAEAWGGAESFQVQSRLAPQRSQRDPLSLAETATSGAPNLETLDPEDPAEGGPAEVKRKDIEFDA